MEPDTTFQLFGRFDGPLNLRLILQPCIAAIFGYLDGTKDANAMISYRFPVALSTRTATGSWRR